MDEAQRLAKTPKREPPGGVQRPPPVLRLPPLAQAIPAGQQQSPSPPQQTTHHRKGVVNLKVKDLIELLKNMNPDSEIRVAGGFTEYSTNNVEVFEEFGEVNIQEKG